MILSPEPPGDGFAVICPAMPGAVSQGDTREEALLNMTESMTLWLEVAVEDGFGPREETPELVAEGIAEVLGWRAEEGWDLLIETATLDVAVGAPA